MAGIVAPGKVFDTKSTSRLKGPRIGMFVDTIRINNQKLQYKIDKAIERSLIRQAARCRGVAKQMVGRGNGNSSVPGKPPKWHGSPFFKMSIMWGYDRVSKTSLAGPAQTTHRGVPRALEHGGTSTWVRRASANRKTRSSKRTYGSKFSSGYVAGRQKVRPRPFMIKALNIVIGEFAGQFRGAVRP